MFINEAPNGGLDLKDLEEKLNRVKPLDKRFKIGSFCAASNVTGILTPVNTVATLLHNHGFYSFWDYATAAPYVEIDMNPIDKNQV